MTWTAHAKPHEIELIEAMEYNYRAAKETAQYTRRLIRDRCRYRARKGTHE
jgi:hypothetical protein